MKASVLIFVVFLLGCSKSTEVQPIDSAFNDGFEVVVIDGNSAIVSKQLKEAELIVTNGGTYLLDTNKLDIIKSELERSNRQSPTSQYPIIGLEIIALKNDEQVINLSYHYSKHTYTYRYRVLKNKIIPRESGYSDLSRNTVVNYK